MIFFVFFSFFSRIFSFFLHFFFIFLHFSIIFHHFPIIFFIFFIFSFRSQAQGSDKVKQVQQQVDEVKGIMHQNIEKVVERGDKIENLQEKTGMNPLFFSLFSSPAISRPGSTRFYPVLPGSARICPPLCSGFFHFFFFFFFFFWAILWK